MAEVSCIWLSMCITCVCVFKHLCVLHNVYMYICIYIYIYIKREGEREREMLFCLEAAGHRALVAEVALGAVGAVVS